MPKRMISIHVWSDIVCPWCWVGLRRFENALSRFGDPVELTFHSFELDPSTSRAMDPAVRYVDRLSAKFGRPSEQMRAMVERMRDTAAAEGLVMNLDAIRPANTFDAHRLLHLAKEKSLDAQHALKRRLMDAHFTEGAELNDPTVLARLAKEVGLDADETLASDRFARAVRADEREAHELGISGVPFFVIGRYGVSGAQPADLLLRVLEDAKKEAA